MFSCGPGLILSTAGGELGQLGQAGEAGDHTGEAALAAGLSIPERESLLERIHFFPPPATMDKTQVCTHTELDEIMVTFRGTRGITRQAGRSGSRSVNIHLYSLPGLSSSCCRLPDFKKIGIGQILPQCGHVHPVPALRSSSGIFLCDIQIKGSSLAKLFTVCFPQADGILVSLPLYLFGAAFEL